MGHYQIPASLLIGYGDIDAEHQGLLDLLNVALRLMQTMTDPPPSSFYPLLEKLRERLTWHFRHEEREMAQLNYPELAQHRLHHAHCVQRLDEICDAVVSGQKKVDRDFLDDLYDMILDDIIRADGGLKSFIQGPGSRVRA
jgi:hemerythrin-like metal-binding protein